MAGEVASCEGVFQSQAGRGTNRSIGLVVGKLLDEGCEVEWLEKKTISTVQHGRQYRERAYEVALGSLG